MKGSIFLSAILSIIFAAGIPGTGGAETLGVGLGFGGSSKPYADALRQLRNNGVYVIKTWC
jgi:hypothetical protein